MSLEFCISYFNQACRTVSLCRNILIIHDGKIYRNPYTHHTDFLQRPPVRTLKCAGHLLSPSEVSEISWISSKNEWHHLEKQLEGNIGKWLDWIRHRSFIFNYTCWEDFHTDIFLSDIDTFINCEPISINFGFFS